MKGADPAEAPSRDATAPVGRTGFERLGEWGAPRTRRRRGPLRRLVLFSSGVDTDLLDLVPEEERNFRILGSSVLLTAALAFISGTVAGFVLLGDDASPFVPFAFGAVFSALVYTIDRIVVALPVNAYRYPRELLAGLWRSPDADAPRVPDVAVRLHSPGWVARVRQIVGTLLGLSLRFALAIILSILIAELLVMGLFDDEIDVRVGAIQTDLGEQRREQVASAFDSQIALLDEELSRIAGDDGPSVQEAEEAVARVRGELAACEAEVAEVAAAKAAEQAGRVETFDINGRQITTSGIVGTGPVFETLEQVEQEVRGRCERLRNELVAAQAELADARAAVEQLAAEQREAVEALEAQRAEVVAERNEAIREAGATATGASGLLLRRQALDDLVSDEVPATVEVEGATDACHDVACEVRRFFVPGTPIGNFVGLVRAGLLLVDTFPVVAKVALSLRRRRPYDALVGAIEERHAADALGLLNRG